MQLFRFGTFVKFPQKNEQISLPVKYFYNIISNNPTIQKILITIEIEFIALASPASPPSSFVNAGAAEAIGLNGNIVRACLTSNENGNKK